LRLEQAAFLAHVREDFVQFLFDAGDRLIERRARRHIVRIGVEGDFFELAGFLARQRVELRNAFDLVAEHGNAPGAVFIVRREDLDGVPAGAEIAARESVVIALVLKRHEIGEELLAGQFLPEL